MRWFAIVLAALVLVLGTHSLTKADAPYGSQWEYRYIRDTGANEKATDECLNKMGADGWELVTVFNGAWFKRALK